MSLWRVLTIWEYEAEDAAEAQRLWEDHGAEVEDPVRLARISGPQEVPDEQ